MTDCTEQASEFLKRLKQAKSAVVLTGAGVSTDSGIPDFRGPSGLYSKISQRTFEIDFFNDFPDEYYKTAIEHIHTLADREPNATHIMLSKLESLGMLKAVITQNIDGLHQKAGSKNVIEFHGDVTRFFCTKCEKEFDRTFVDEQIRTKGIPTCSECNELVRPGIVFFGDMIPMDALYDSQFLSETADLFITMGSSLAVNPAASLALNAQRSGAGLIIINRGPTNLDPIAAEKYEVPLADFSNAVMACL